VDRLRVPAVLESMDEVVRYVRELSRAAGLSTRYAGRLRLAAEELVTNVIVHGYQGRAAPGGDVELAGGVDRDRVWLRISDDGPYFDPTRVAPPQDLDRQLSERMPGGLGLYLVKAFVDDMRYEWVGGRNTVIVAMSRRGGTQPTPMGGGDTRVRSRGGGEGA
jgi:serine/threonine-protein kinase RsbW